ncbi:MAG TPA: cysteine--tRNA ligase [Solirubrobacteraceae bacterium]|nr:cysteine--tRNA ligase [Solirubrobacteraceae bacterium]
MRTVRLHDSRSGELRELRADGTIGIYACGPTVYNRIHIGNARPFVVFSLLARFLRAEGRDVRLVMNVTDVNDKIYAAARERDVKSDALAAEMLARYRADTDALGLGRPDEEPLASQMIEPIIEEIAALVERGHAYAAGGDVYFRVRSDPSYGSLSHRDVADMDQGEGVEGAERKQDPLDFALWKGAKADEDTSWESPWGAGRPGWHIECSAMAERLLGLEFDVHGGGADLLFPHHENEAAQTRSARGRELARIWMHNGMIQMSGEKMAKSVGNIALLHEVLAAHGRDAVVMYLASGHYRQPLAFSEDELLEAGRRVERIRECLGRLAGGAESPPDMAGRRDAFFDALADDFNTAAALAALFEWVREANRRGAGVGDGDLRAMLDVLGLGALEGLASDAAAMGARAAELLARREQARRDRDFAAADELRDELRALGWEIRDGPDGPELIARGA